MPRVDARNSTHDALRRRNPGQEARNSTDSFRSRGAHDGAAGAALAIELEPIAQRTLTAGAARVAQLDVMCPAGARGLFLSVAGAAVPNTFAEGHPGPSRAQSRGNVGAGVQVVCPETPIETARASPAVRRDERELPCPLRSRGDD